MALALSIVAIISIVIFLFAYLSVAIASFRHHFITGLIALIPGINVVVLPTIWHKAGKNVISGGLALGIGLIAWQSGANSFINDKIKVALNSEQTADSAHNPFNVEDIEKSQSSTPKEKNKSVKTRQVGLPQHPLYQLVFEDISIQDIGTLKNPFLRITRIDETTIEGRTPKISSSSLFIERHSNGSTFQYEVPFKHIKKLEKMVRLPTG